MITPTIKNLLRSSGPGKNIKVRGWVKTVRQSKSCIFSEINDGSCRANLQAVFNGGEEDLYKEAQKLTAGTSVELTGDLVLSPAKGQKFELSVGALKIYGGCDPEKYPIQKKKTSDEFLRTVAHLRPRTNKYAAMLRIRSELAYQIHSYFHSKEFCYVHTPIFTTSDCEGAGEVFTATALDLGDIARLPKTDKGEIDFSKDIFGKKTYLTVSGQLEGESLAMGLGKIYTFGPTFRAENSNTYRHCAEFWQIEPEMAFYELEDNMELAEDFIKTVVSNILEKAPEDMELFTKFVDPSLLADLKNLTGSKFERLAYTDAVKILEPENGRFEVKISWGVDLSSEHERFLVEQYFKRPVILYNKPKEAASFYMKLNEDGKTCRGMDVLVPRIGEIIGGSERESSLETLQRRMTEKHMNQAPYWWFTDLRRFGSVPHSGFGLGFERLMMLVTGITNIRDVTAYPRVPGFAEF